MDAKNARKIVAAIKKELEAAPKELVYWCEYVPVWPKFLNTQIGLRPFYRGGQSLYLGEYDFRKLLRDVELLAIPAHWLFNGRGVQWARIIRALNASLAEIPLTVTLSNREDILGNLTTEGWSNFRDPDGLDYLEIELCCQHGKVINVRTQCSLRELFSPSACRRIKKSVTWSKNNERSGRIETVDAL